MIVETFEKTMKERAAALEPDAAKVLKPARGFTS